MPRRQPDLVTFRRIVGGVWNFGLDKLLSFQSLIGYCGSLKEKNIEGNADVGVSLVIFQRESLKRLSGLFECEQTLLKRSCVCRD